MHFGLHVDFTEVMDKKITLPPPEDGDGRQSLPANFAASDLVSLPMVVHCNVTGVDEVMKKAMEDAQAGHKAAVSESIYIIIMLVIQASS